MIKLNLSNNKTTKAVDTMSTESKSDTEDIVSKKESYKEPPIVPNMDRLILTQSTNKFAGCSSQFIELNNILDQTYFGIREQLPLHLEAHASVGQDPIVHARYLSYLFEGR